MKQDEIPRNVSSIHPSRLEPVLRQNSAHHSGICKRLMRLWIGCGQPSARTSGTVEMVLHLNRKNCLKFHYGEDTERSLAANTSPSAAAAQSEAEA